MSVPSEPSPASDQRQTRRTRLVIGALCVTAVLAYANSFSSPFVFDDIPAILENPAIRDGRVGQLFASDQPGGLTVSGRPLLALSFALNHAISGQAVWSYHAVNFAIHLGAGLLLFGIVRRTPASRLLCERDAAALIIAALWLLHPLQTESVTYIVQRAESLAGFLYLLTLYAFVRATAFGSCGSELAREISRPSRERARSHSFQPRWLALSVVACLLGMASKEVVVSAPLIVLLYDRTFISGTFRAAWQRRRGYYLALAATWIALAILVMKNAGRGGTAGFDTEISPWSYLLTQCDAIVRYLGLSVWPHPLIFDHGTAVASSLSDVFWSGTVVLVLLVLGIWLVLKKPRTGFLAVCFFALLAPSSSFVPIATQTIAEHRMYLPLAALLAASVSGVHALVGARAWMPSAIAAIALLAATSARNRDYRSEAAIWTVTVARLPTNARAHNNLGQALFRAGRIDESIERYRRALELQPKYPEPHYNLGVALARAGQRERAVESYEAALRLQPVYPEAHTNLGNALLHLGRTEEALRHLETALAQRPDFAEAHNNFGNALLHDGRPAEAVEPFLRALQLKPDYAEARYNLGNALAAAGQMAAAFEQYRKALASRPDYAEAHVNAGNALLELNRTPEAVVHYEKALAVNSALRIARENLAAALMDLERWPEAIAHYEKLVAVQPDSPIAHRALGFAHARLGHVPKAITHYEHYLRARPDDITARDELAQLRRQK